MHVELTSFIKFVSKYKLMLKVLLVAEMLWSVTIVQARRCIREESTIIIATLHKFTHEIFLQLKLDQMLKN